VSDTSRAIALMIVSMAAFALGDALVKAASEYLSVAQVLIFMALPAVAIFAVLAQRAGQPVFSRDFFARASLLRNGIESLTAICMVSALAAAPLSLVISITQAVPLLVTLGAALVLREAVGPRRWAAILIGLIGVLVMLRPDTSGLSLGALFALGAAVGLAVRDLVTRVTPARIGTLQMATWGMCALVFAGAALMPFTGPHPVIPPMGWVIVGFAAIANAVGYYAITAAMRIGDVAAVTPFRYSRLIFALILAVLVFGERPDALTLLGALIVIGSGLYVMWRERRVAAKS